MNTHALENNSMSSTLHQDAVRIVVFGFALIIAASAVASRTVIGCSLCCMIAAIVGCRVLFAYHVRPIAIIFLACGIIASGQAAAWALGNTSALAMILGVEHTLTAVQSISLGAMTLGTIVALRALSQSTSAIGIADAATLTLLVSSRFAAHRNFQWSHPRMLSDWSGIHGYDMPFIFAILGLTLLVAAMVLGMRTRSWQRGIGSILTIIALLALFVLLGSKFVRNPQMVYTAPAAGSSTSDTTADNGSAVSGNDHNGASANNATSGADSDTGNRANQSTQPQFAAQDSPEPVALVLLENDHQPQEKAWYFRQTAASQFNGRRLVVVANSEWDTDVISHFSSTNTNVDVPKPEGMHVEVSSIVSLIKEQPRPFGLPSVSQYEPMENTNPNYFRRRYRATSVVLMPPTIDDEEQDLYGQLCLIDSGDPSWNETTRQHYLRHPDDSRYQALADRIVDEELNLDSMIDTVQDSAMLKALAIKRWMEKNTIYSQNAAEPKEGENPADTFLFGERKGYCTHIAHSAVYLMRAAGIPARMGLGYSVPLDRSGKSSAILIQTTDAHVWPEIYLENVGWVIVDISPQNVDKATILPPEPDAKVTKFLADQARQKAGHQKALAQTQGFQRHLTIPNKIMLTLVMVLLLAYIVKTTIRWSPHFVQLRWLASAAYLSTALRLAECGLCRNFGETREQYATRLSQMVPALRELTSAHQMANFGSNRPQERLQWLAMTSQVRSDLRRAVPQWKQLLGLADPRFWNMLR